MEAAFQRDKTMPEEKECMDSENYNIKPFSKTLSEHGLTLERGDTRTLQVNVGFLCNQQCRHCHLGAGPDRIENMTAETAHDVISYAEKGNFDVLDITGGAPELNPNIDILINGFTSHVNRVMIRSNLSVLNDGKRDYLYDSFKKNSVVIVASFPSLNERQTDSQRGSGVFKTSISALQKLNSMGYGIKGSGLDLNLVSNPSGAFLPTKQKHEESRFRDILRAKWGIEFNRLFNFANVPLGRFRQWLEDSGNLEAYIDRLSTSFNPRAVEKVMCRNLVSVSWSGYLFDCDFNLARGLYLSGKKIHVNESDTPPVKGTPIAVSDHCYACTSGTGFT